MFQRYQLKGQDLCLRQSDARLIKYLTGSGKNTKVTKRELVRRFFGSPYLPG
jgi:hypothetical protein